MEKYILNNTPIRTSNNYKINDIEVELDIPNEIDNFKETISSYSNDIEITSSIENNFNSKIGLVLDKYYKLNINIKDNANIKENLILEYNITNKLINEICINIGKNSNINLIIKYLSNGKVFHHLKQVTNLDESSKANITIINMLDNDSTSLVAIETYLKDNSILDYNFFDLSGSMRISNYYSKLNGKCSINNLNTMYIGNNKDKIDMNYYIENIGMKSKSNILTEGCLNDSSIKSYKGTINFISGCSKSIGEELEECILLSDKAKSKSLPMLLCGEEDVIGSHGVSTGKIDKDKLFYLESRGLTDKEANKLILNAKFNRIINNVNDENIKEEIFNYINKILD